MVSRLHTLTTQVSMMSIAHSTCSRIHKSGKGIVTFACLHPNHHTQDQRSLLNITTPTSDIYQPIAATTKYQEIGSRFASETIPKTMSSTVSESEGAGCVSSYPLVCAERAHRSNKTNSQFYKYTLQCSLHHRPFSSSRFPLYPKIFTIQGQS